MKELRLTMTLMRLSRVRQAAERVELDPLTRLHFSRTKCDADTVVKLRVTRTTSTSIRQGIDHGKVRSLSALVQEVKIPSKGTRPHVQHASSLLRCVMNIATRSAWRRVPRSVEVVGVLVMR